MRISLSKRSMENSVVEQCVSDRWLRLWRGDAAAGRAGYLPGWDLGRGKGTTLGRIPPRSLRRWVCETNHRLGEERDAAQDYPESGSTASLVCLWLGPADRSLWLGDRGRGAGPCERAGALLGLRAAGSGLRQAGGPALRVCAALGDPGVSGLRDAPGRLSAPRCPSGGSSLVPRQASVVQQLCLFLANWAKRLSWKEVAEVFRTSWDKV